MGRFTLHKITSFRRSCVWLTHTHKRSHKLVRALDLDAHAWPREFVRICCAATCVCVCVRYTSRQTRVLEIIITTSQRQPQRRLFLCMCVMFSSSSLYVRTNAVAAPDTHSIIYAYNIGMEPSSYSVQAHFTWRSIFRVCSVVSIYLAELNNSTQFFFLLFVVYVVSQFVCAYCGHSVA